MASRETPVLPEASGSEDKEMGFPEKKELSDEKAKCLPVVDDLKPKIVIPEILPGPVVEAKQSAEKMGAIPKVFKVKAQAECSKETPLETASPSHCPSYSVPEIRTTLSPLIKEEDYRECYRRVYKSHYGLRLKQEREAKERPIREPGKPEGYYESLENKDEISARSWLKHALPREAIFLLSLVSKAEPISAEPPSPEDDRTYSLSEGIVSEENVESWKTGLALGIELMQIGRGCDSIIAEIQTELDPGQLLTRDYFTDDLSLALINIENEIAIFYGLKPPHMEDIRRASTSTSYDLEDEDTSKGVPFLRRDSAATDVDSEMISDSMSDISDCLRRNSFSAGTPSSGSFIVSSDSSGPPPPPPSLDF